MFTGTSRDESYGFSEDDNLNLNTMRLNKYI